MVSFFIFADAIQSIIA